MVYACLNNSKPSSKNVRVRWRRTGTNRTHCGKKEERFRRKRAHLISNLVPTMLIPPPVLSIVRNVRKQHRPVHIHTSEQPNTIKNTKQNILSLRIQHIGRTGGNGKNTHCQFRANFHRLPSPPHTTSNMHTKNCTMADSNNNDVKMFTSPSNRPRSGATTDKKSKPSGTERWGTRGHRARTKQYPPISPLPDNVQTP